MRNGLRRWGRQRWLCNVRTISLIRDFPFLYFRTAGILTSISYMNFLHLILTFVCVRCACSCSWSCFSSRFFIENLVPSVVMNFFPWFLLLYFIACPAQAYIYTSAWQHSTRPNAHEFIAFVFSLLAYVQCPPTDPIFLHLPICKRCGTCENHSLLSDFLTRTILFTRLFIDRHRCCLVSLSTNTISYNIQSILLLGTYTVRSIENFRSLQLCSPILIILTTQNGQSQASALLTPNRTIFCEE